MKKLALILAILLAFLNGISQSTDIVLLRKINLEGNESLDPGFRAITKSVTPLLIAVPAGILTEHLIKKDQKSRQRLVLVCSSILMSGIFTTTLKYGLNRDRPFVTYPDIEQETSASSSSFPSGHTSSAFSLATSLSIAYPKWYVAVPSYVWATAVGYSRMDLGVHYPSDVLAGAIIGSGSAYLCYKINKALNKRHADRKKIED